MRILLLQDDFPPHSFGGAGIIAYNLAREFQKNGHEILVVTTSREKKDEGTSHFDGLSVHTIATAYDLRFNAYVSLWNIPVVAKMQKILAEFKPDVVHAHNVHGHLSYGSLIAAKKSGARVILTCHDVMSFSYQKLTEFIDPTDLSVPTRFNYHVSAWHQFITNRFRYNPLRNLIIRRILKKNVDHIVAVSDALKQALNDNGIGNVQTIHNGIDAKEWEESTDAIVAFKQSHGVGNAAMLFGGRLSGAKGSVKSIDVLARVREVLPEAQLMIVGRKDAYTEKMLAYARTLGVAGNVRCVGWLSGHDLRCAYHAASVVIVPSLYLDPFPTVNLEAMACKKPVVATCWGGSKEVVLDGETGYIVDPFDVSISSKKSLELLRNKKKNIAFGEAGYRRVVSNFSLSQQAVAYEKLFI